MSHREDIMDRYLNFASDINRNLSNIIHLTNNLRYNTFQVFNNYTNGNLLTNDVFFPPLISPRQPTNPPPLIRRRSSRRRSTLPPRLVATGAGLPILPNLPNYIPTPHTYPSSNQIISATESALFSDISTNYLMCPISRDNFESGERILRIRQCGHVFRATTLRQWFRTSSECPVCRYNIRHYNRNESTSRDILPPIRRAYDASSNLLSRDISNNGSNFTFHVGGFFT